MITIATSTARGAVWATLLAVLFATRLLASDSSLVQLEDRVNDLIYDASRSVVTVEAVQTRAPGTAGQEAVHSLVASGLIYDSLGHILVAASSVYGRDRILVHYESKPILARVKGIDYRTGLALLELNRPIGVPARLSLSKGCAGQMVIALGNAYGVRASPSIGFCAGFRPDGAMQFSAPITAGTVGGGVFDLSGNLIGAITGGIGRDRWAEVGLAVAASDLPEIVNWLDHHGDRVAGYAGITVTDIEITPGIEIGAPVSLVSEGRSHGRVVERGVMVTSVVPNSPAARAGLGQGDLLFSINGLDIQSALDMREMVRSSRPGTLMDISFIRDNSPYTTRLEVGQAQPTRFSSPFWESSDPGETDAVSADSLAREIESLKRTLQSLEQRVRKLQ